MFADLCDYCFRSLRVMWLLKIYEFQEILIDFLNVLPAFLIYL